MKIEATTNWIDLERRLMEPSNSGMSAKALVLEAADAINELRKERDYWRSAAAYLASCHAATAEHDGSLKSTSKSRLDRLKSICATAVLMLDFQWHPRYDADGRIDASRERCDKAARL